MRWDSGMVSLKTFYAVHNSASRIIEKFIFYYINRLVDGCSIYGIAVIAGCYIKYSIKLVNY
jgi:hypothetical protein